MKQPIPEDVQNYSCVIVTDDKPLNNLEIRFFGLEKKTHPTACLNRNHTNVSISTDEEKIVAPIQDYNKNKHSVWFLCDSSRFLFASGTGTKPSSKTVEILISDKKFPPSVEVEITTTNKNVRSRIMPAPVLHLSLNKWNIDRSLNSFKGNTIVCNVKKQTPEFEAFLNAQEKFKALSLGYSQAFLPPDSFHVTILSLVNEGNYSSVVKKSQNKVNWEQLHKSYKQKLARVLTRYENVTLEMKVKQFEAKRHFGAIVEPSDQKSKQLLDRMHHDFSRAAGFRNESNRYPYHVSLAYQFLPVMPHLSGTKEEFIRQLESEILPLNFTLLPPFFAIFNDMGEFSPL